MFHMIYFSIIDVRAFDLDTEPSMYIILDNIKCQGHMLQVKVKVILGTKSLQTGYISHRAVDVLENSCTKDVITVSQSLFWSNSSEYESDIRGQYKCHFSYTSTCAPYWQVPVEVYRGGPSLYGN